ncbi:MAG TPA: hypothetical protein VHZ95_04710, partial [Polyangiales bacterium]|nr:hypothetical protein [Polyangiales bacterium]
MSVTERELKAKEAARDAVREKSGAAKSAMDVLSAEIVRLQKQIHDWTQSDAAHAENWRSLCAQIDVQLQDRAALDAHIESHGARLKQAQDTLDSIDALNGAIERRVQARHVAEKTSAQREHDLRLVEEKHSAGEKALAETTDAAIARRESLVQRDQAMNVTVIEAGYTPLDDWTPWRDWLTQRDDEWRTWQAASQRAALLARQADTARQALDTAASEEEKWTARWRACEPSYSSLELEARDLSKNPDDDFEHEVTRHDTARDRANALEGKEKTLAVRLSEEASRRDETAKSWGDALALSRFESERAFIDALLAHEERDRLQALKAALDRLSTEARALREAAEKRRAELSAEPQTDQPAEVLQAQVDELAAALRAANERQGAIRETLRNDAQQRANRQALIADIDAQQKRYDLWQRLSSLIGSADGAKYRKFAQGLTLDHLIYLANRQLVQLHGRYQLNRKAGGDLEMEVVDTWQGDVARDTRTLSGGESFLVSLALALALSDLVSHK